MKYFTVIYMMPSEKLQEWAKLPKEEREASEGPMKKEWDEWLKAHEGTVMNTIGLGKAKRVSAKGVEDATNDMMLSSYVQAESAEAAAELFKDHPHLKLPGATIEVMEANQLTGM